jgi:hypothetical protein
MLRPARRLHSSMRPWCGAVLLLVLAACGGGDATGPGSNPATDPTPPPPPSGTAVLRTTAAWPPGVEAVVQLQPSAGGAAVRLESGASRSMPSGSYTVVAPPVTDVRGHVWTSPQHGQAVLVQIGASVDIDITYRQRTGALLVRLDGLSREQLPAPGADGHSAFAVQREDSLSAPARLVYADDTLRGLWPGVWRLRAVRLTDLQGDAWAASDTLLSFAIDTAGQTRAVSVSYAPAPSAVQFAATGRPPNSPTVLNATRADGPHDASLGVRYGDWPRGPSTVVWPTFVRSGARWGSAPLMWTHRNGLDTTITLSVQLEAGRVALVPSGLPLDALPLARWTLSGGPTERTLTTPVSDLVAAGSHTLRALPVELDEVRWQAEGAVGSASGTPLAVQDSLSTLAIAYAPQSGALRVLVDGVPNGAASAIRVEAVSGRAISAPGLVATVASTTQFDSLAPGSYRVIAPALLAPGGIRYRASTDTATITVRSGDTVQLAVSYAEAPAIVRVLVTGLPAGLGVTPQTSLQSGASAPVVVPPSGLVPNWPAGASTARLTAVTADGARWEAPPVTWTHLAGADTTIVLQAALTAGRLQIDPGQLPGSGHGAVAWTLAVAGQPLRTGSGLVLDEVPVGSFTLQLGEVIADADRWRPASLSAVPGTMNAAQVTWLSHYARVTGHLSLVSTGLPNGASPSLRVARPSLPLLTVTRDSVVRGIAIGNTTVTADTVSVGGIAYAATPRVSTYNFAGAGETRQAAIVYAAVGAPPPPPPPPADGLVTDQVLITQAIQTVQGNVPLVADRPALLRVVVRATTSGPSNASVRVRLFHGASLMKDTVLTRSGLVPTVRADGTLSSTWNWQLPASLVKPGLTVTAEADPAQAIADGDRTDNVWPRTGSTGSIPEVRVVPPWRPVLVPVEFTSVGLTGDVTVANAESRYLDLVRRTMPLAEVIPSVRAPFAIDDPMPASNDGTAWVNILSKINALRLAEATSTQQFYYGVLPITYNSGIAGMGYVPGRASVGWDKASSAAYVAAHEWGHNFSLWHGPCGNPGSEDPSFPHAGGTIGGHGWDVVSNTLRPPTNFDLMGYCAIAQSWISDYFWTKALNHRVASGVVMGSTMSLVVSGRIDGSRVRLEPAWLSEGARPESPRSGPATHVLRLLDASGELLLERPITPERVDHADVRLFGEAVPVTDAIADRVARIEVRDLRSPVVRGMIDRSALRTQADAGRIDRERLRADAVRARGAARASVDTATVRRVIVRDAASRRLVGVFDQGTVPAAYDVAAYEWLVSDGVRSWPVARR